MLPRFLLSNILLGLRLDEVEAVLHRQTVLLLLGLQIRLLSRKVPIGQTQYNSGFRLLN